MCGNLPEAAGSVGKVWIPVGLVVDGAASSEIDRSARKPREVVRAHHITCAVAADAPQWTVTLGDWERRNMSLGIRGWRSMSPDTLGFIPLQLLLSEYLLPYSSARLWV